MAVLFQLCSFPNFFIQVFFQWTQRKGAHVIAFYQQALLKRGIVELLLTSDLMNDVRKGHLKGGTDVEQFEGITGALT